MFDLEQFFFTLPTGEQYTVAEARSNPEIHDMILDVMSNPDYLYVPDPQLAQRIQDFRIWCDTEADEDPGQLMEEIAYLAFKGLRGWNTTLSFQSVSDQIDLLISGDGLWDSLIRFLGLKGFPTFIVEAKNLSDTVDVQQFMRLCGIIQNVYDYQCRLGVFVTRHGAAGIPRARDRRRRSLQHAWVTQVIFHARTQKFVVVLDEDDLDELLVVGGLPKLLRAKMNMVEAMTGLETILPQNFHRVDLPPHLARHNT